MRLMHYTNPTSRSLAPGFGSLLRTPWSGLESELDRLFETALGDFAPSAGRFPVDLYEDADNTYVRADMPGVNREDINVELVDGYLNISATRKNQSGENEEETFSINRSVTVPDTAVQADKISAAYEDGVLTVTLPKREEAKPRKVKVNVK